LAISAAPAALVWRQPTATEALLLAAIGLLGVGSQSLMIRAFRAGEASFVAPYLGAAIIVAATLYLARQGSRRK
jgi:drug/metabolite transporter (DMT)-like permease